VIASPAEPFPSKSENAKLDEPIVTALRAYLNKQPEQALEALHHYGKPNQDVLLIVLPLLARLAEGSLKEVGSAEATGLLGQLRSLENVIRDHAALHIDKMLFCRKINGFGRIEPIEKGHLFEAGREGKPGEWVQVYVELANVASKQNGSWHETWLAGRVEIRDFNRKVVWFENHPPCPDRSHSPRRDYFISYHFWVPPCLPPGRYTLQVEIKDVTLLPVRDSAGVSPQPLEVPPQRRASRSLDFQVTSKGQ
jgi:hypothetical protein